MFYMPGVVAQSPQPETNVLKAFDGTDFGVKVDSKEGRESD